MDEEKYLDISAIRAAIIKIFYDSDDDGNGYLTIDEFMLQLKQFDRHFTSLLNRLPNPLILELIKEADCSQDGVVPFDEFVPFCARMIMAFRPRNFGPKVGACPPPPPAPPAVALSCPRPISTPHHHGCLIPSFLQRADEYMKNVADTVRDIMSATGVDKTVAAFVAAFKRVDVENQGILRVKVRAYFTPCGHHALCHHSLTRPLSPLSHMPLATTLTRPSPPHSHHHSLLATPPL